MNKTNSTKEQRAELYAAAEARRNAISAERRAASKVKNNPRHWLRSFEKLQAANARYETAKQCVA